MSKKRLLIGIVVVGALVAGTLTWRESRTVSTPLQIVNADPSLISKGEYLAQMGDCTACHTSDDGAFFAGGHAVATPFGTIYGANLTPSADHGIGRWTADDFHMALTEGVSPPSRHLYPAMPYASFHDITREDSDALYAYLMSLEPVDVTVATTALPFPFNQRASLIGWNMLFFDKNEPVATSIGSSESWQRGKYLVDTLGHCAMCHAPLGELGGLDKSALMTGGNIARFKGPDITPEALSERGWSPESLKQYLTTGLAPQGSAFGDMYKVVSYSLQYSTDEDANALVTYLMGDNPLPAKEITIGEDINPAGKALYTTLCASCHIEDGSGQPHTAIAMINNSTVRNIDPNNLIMAIFDGIPAQAFPNNERMAGMPSFIDKLNNQQTADLVNYLRHKWGGIKMDISAQDIQQYR